MTSSRLKSIAIAGAWGYIGHKFVEAGLDLGLDVHVFDPGPPPGDLALEHLHRVEDETEFYELDTDLYHLALHPQHRSTALSRLLPRAGVENILILNEKPMAEPERPHEPMRLLEEVEASGATVLFDFPELFDPLTHQTLSFLQQFDDVCIDEILIQRSKDREARDNPRNRKRMVHIQYQESVHCLAFVLNLLAHTRGGEAALASGLIVTASAEPYVKMTLGETAVHGHTDFKRNAPWRKQRVIRGRGDGTPFEIDVDYLEGGKYLRINGDDQTCDPAGSSYEAVLLGLQKWHEELTGNELMQGIYPNPAFAYLTYQLSSLLWRASHDQAQIRIQDANALRAFEAGFEDAVPTFSTYD